MARFLCAIMILAAVIGCKREHEPFSMFNNNRSEQYANNSILGDSLKNAWMRQDTSKVRSLLAELFDPNRNDTLFFDLLINYGDAIGFRFGVFDLSHDNKNSQWRMYSFQQRWFVRYNIALVYQSLANSKFLFSSFGNELDDRLESKLWTIDYFLDPVVVDSIIASLEY